MGAELAAEDAALSTLVAALRASVLAAALDSVSPDLGRARGTRRSERGYELPCARHVSSRQRALPAKNRSALCVTTGRLEAEIADGVRWVVAPPHSIWETPADDRDWNGRRSLF